MNTTSITFIIDVDTTYRDVYEQLGNLLDDAGYKHRISKQYPRLNNKGIDAEVEFFDEVPNAREIETFHKTLNTKLKHIGKQHD